MYNEPGTLFQGPLIKMKTMLIAVDGKLFDCLEANRKTKWGRIETRKWWINLKTRYNALHDDVFLGISGGAWKNK